MYFNCCLGQMFVSDVFDFQFVGKVEPYFLSAGEEVLKETKENTISSAYFLVLQNVFICILLRYTIIHTS